MNPSHLLTRSFARGGGGCLLLQECVRRPPLANHQLSQSDWQQSMRLVCSPHTAVSRLHHFSRAVSDRDRSVEVELDAHWQTRLPAPPCTAFTVTKRTRRLLLSHTLHLREAYQRHRGQPESRVYTANTTRGCRVESSLCHQSLELPVAITTTTMMSVGT